MSKILKSGITKLNNNEDYQYKAVNFRIANCMNKDLFVNPCYELVIYDSAMLHHINHKTAKTKQTLLKAIKKEIDHLLGHVIQFRIKNLTGVYLMNNESQVLKSDFGNIKITLDLNSDFPTIFTKLENKEYYNTHGYSEFTGKQNYHGIESIHYFINTVLKYHNIKELANEK